MTNMASVDIDDLKETAMLLSSKLSQVVSIRRPEDMAVSLPRCTLEIINFLSQDSDADWSHRKTAITEAVETVCLPALLGRDIPIGHKDSVLDFVINRAKKNVEWLAKPLPDIVERLEEKVTQDDAKKSAYLRAKGLDGKDFNNKVQAKRHSQSTHERILKMMNENGASAQSITISKKKK